MTKEKSTEYLESNIEKSLERWKGCYIVQSVKMNLEKGLIHVMYVVANL
jgi:copper chaperone CopZ